MDGKLWERVIAGALMVYLLAMALFASANLVASFDSAPATTQANGQYAATQPGTLTGSQVDPPVGGVVPVRVAATKAADAPCSSWLVTCYVQSENSKLLMQAVLAGVIGSFLHAAQSLTSYVGNDTFKLSWVPWYVMRPWIGGILALAMALAAQAGL